MDDRIDKLLGQWSAERPELDCSGLDVVARLQDLAKLLRRNENAALETLGLSMLEYDVLSALRRQGKPFTMAVSELARESLLSSGAMTNRIDRLEARELVARAPDPSDRRGVLVSLSAAGKELIDQAVEARLRAAEHQLARLSAGERRSLVQGLRKITAVPAG